MMTTLTPAATFGPEELRLIHGLCWRFSTSFNGDRWRAMFNALPEDEKERIRAKARWERMSLSAVIADWWPELHTACAVVNLYSATSERPFIVGHVDSDGQTLMRTERSWQRKYHAARINPDDYLADIDGRNFVPLRDALARASS